MELRGKHGADTPEQRYCGVWYDCVSRCSNSRLYMSAALLAEYARVGALSLSPRPSQPNPGQS